LKILNFIMRTTDLFEETSLALLANKARSSLTILGIVIGIASVIAMIAIGQGAKNNIESSIQSLGSNLVLVMPGMQRSAGAGVSQARGSATTLTLDDAEAIASQVAAVAAVAPDLSGRYQVTAKGTNSNTSIVGTTASYPTIRSVEVAEGNFITEQNVKSLSKVAVLGPTARDDLFGEDFNPVGQTIRIKSIDFKVIGVTAEKGGSGFSNQDDMIFIPISTAQQFLAGSTKVSTISVQAEDQESMTQMQQDITDLLLARHNITNAALADFSTMNQSDVIATASSVTDTFTALLGSVAAISLLVGGIGIMNMMLTTVKERTREIGLRKAIGAKRRDISWQFLLEAMMLTFLGGIIGVILGWLISLIIRQFANIAASVSLSSVFLAFGVSAAIGIIFGYYPARSASRLNPIEALRYE
jgi:putative ABC transport system permease protein